MVTLSIAEEGGVITALIQQVFADKGIPFCYTGEQNAEGYIFLPPQQAATRDVVLLHDSSAPDCRGDYVTLLNADAPIASYNKKSLLITYGLNPLSTVTASSIRVDDEKTMFFCCLQRSIATLKGKILEPQEFLVHIPAPMPDFGAALGFVSLGLVFSWLPNEFSVLFPGKKALSNFDGKIL